jgi:hypothetical protein
MVAWSSLLTRRRLTCALATGAVVVAGLVSVPPAHAAPCSPTISTDGAATVVSFVATGTCTWTVPSDIALLNAVLIVGGGGGGGFDIGGGGGAGGLIDLTDVPVTPGATISVTVGAGGPGATNYTPTSANSGGNTVFNGVTALGGGYGGSGSVAGANGGSGGGGGYAASNARMGGTALQPTAATAGLGNTGGASPWFHFGLVDGGGGGGGAGAAGQDTWRDLNYWPNAQGGNGGSGVARSITGSVAYYAGGGGAGSQVAIATGGSGVGGNGGTIDTAAIVATAGSAAAGGAANTGSGGGGGKNVGVGGAGAAGVVIVRYGAPAPAISAGPQPPSWFQSVGRFTAEETCPVGWSSSWDGWMNDQRGGWVCNRETYWDLLTGSWLHR